ncbi:MAG: MATE family efflux transporter [Clostridia bacterium]|nr:MATE family efflux transporter [Clostridia bacterium]
MKKYIREGLPYYKRMLIIAVPIMIQNGVTNFVNMLDNIMVGQVGTAEMTGVSIVNQLFFVFNLCIFGALSGAGIFTAQFYGKKDTDGIRTTFQYKIISAIILTVIGVCVFVFAGEFLISAYIDKNASAEEAATVLGFAVSYLKIMLIQTLPFAIAQSYASSLRETNDRLIPMIATIAAVLVNLVLNYILIFGHFGFPAMGIKGAAIATVIARFAECFILVIRAHTKTTKYPFVKKLYTRFTFTPALIGKITVVTLPLLLNEGLWSGGMAFLNQCYSIRGLDVVAAINIVSTLNNVFNVSFIAFGSAIGIILSQTLGAGKKDEAKKASSRLVWFSVLVIVFVALLMMCFAPFFPRIYNTSDEIKTLATGLLFIIAAFMPVQALNNSCYFTLRSGGKTFITFLFDSGFMWCVSASLAFCLSRFTDMPIQQLYTCVLSMDIIKGILGYIFMKKGIWLNVVVNEN